MIADIICCFHSKSGYKNKSLSALCVIYIFNHTASVTDKRSSGSVITLDPLMFSHLIFLISEYSFAISARFRPKSAGSTMFRLESMR